MKISKIILSSILISNLFAMQDDEILNIKEFYTKLKNQFKSGFLEGNGGRKYLNLKKIPKMDMNFKSNFNANESILKSPYKGFNVFISDILNGVKDEVKNFTKPEQLNINDLEIIFSNSTILFKIQNKDKGLFSLVKCATYYYCNKDFPTVGREYFKSFFEDKDENDNNEFIDKFIEILKYNSELESTVISDYIQKDKLDLIEKIKKQRDEENRKLEQEKIAIEAEKRRLEEIERNKPENKLVKNIEDTIKGTDNSQEIEQILEYADQDTKEKLDNILENAKYLQMAIVENKKTAIKLLSKLRLNAISSKENIEPLNNKDEVKTSDIIIDIVSENNLSKQILSQNESKKVIEDINNITQGINEILEPNNKNTIENIINFNLNNSSNIRLAQLSNPINNNLEFAKIIKHLSKDKFVNNNFNDAIKEYYKNATNNYNIWANIIAGKIKSKNYNNPYFYGVSFGIDKKIDNLVIGVSSSHIGSKIESKYHKNQSNTFNINTYTRYYFNNNELDGQLSIGFTSNHRKRFLTINDPINKDKKRIYEQTTGYQNDFININLKYGRVFSINEYFLIKPHIGFKYFLNISPEFKEYGDLPSITQKTNSIILMLDAGLEFRKYINEENYLYINPSIQSEIYKKDKGVNFSLIGSDKQIIFTDKNKNKFYSIQGGYNFAINEKISTNLDLGLKTNAKDYFYSINLGIRYKF